MEQPLGALTNSSAEGDWQLVRTFERQEGGALDAGGTCE